jgi:UDP-2,3-diacylglucosamine hydrolase
MSKAAAVFMSDAHLGSESRRLEAEREARLIEFLEGLPDRTRALYIAGDLFEFWFEYGTVIPKRYVGLLGVLRRLRDQGLEITCLAGNHDFWLGPFLRDEIGLTTAEGPFELELEGHRIWIHHGDGLIGGDLGYKILKRVIRHPVSLALYRWLHPDLGIPLAHQCSRWSRGSRDQRPLDGERLFREIAVPRFRDGFDTVMIGHFHHAYERRDGTHAFFVLGDWMKHFTYVELREGAFSLNVWPSGAESKALRIGP